MSMDPTPRPPDAGTGEHSQADGPITYEATGLDREPTGEAEPQGDEVTYTGHDDNSSTAEDVGDAEPEPVTQWPHEAIVKTVQGEDKTVKATPAKRTTKKKAS